MLLKFGKAVSVGCLGADVFSLLLSHPAPVNNTTTKKYYRHGVSEIKPLDHSKFHCKLEILTDSQTLVIGY